MGRAQTFDTSEVVRAARTVFWQNGFEGASLPLLEQATGLGRSSIYHAFESKRGLFDAAVESYLDEVIRPRLRPLQQDRVAPAAVSDYLAGLRGELRNQGSLPMQSGCLLINAATAPIGQDDAVAQRVNDYRAELRAALGNGIAAQLPHLGRRELNRLAGACTGLVITAFALVRVDPDAAVGSLDTALALIDAAASDA